MYVHRLVPNNAYAILFGDSIIDIDGKRFFDTIKELNRKPAALVGDGSDGFGANGFQRKRNQSENQYRGNTADNLRQTHTIVPRRERIG